VTDERKSGFLYILYVFFKQLTKKIKNKKNKNSIQSNKKSKKFQKKHKKRFFIGIFFAVLPLRRYGGGCGVLIHSRANSFIFYCRFCVKKIEIPR
jgi:hypothetical protein